MSTLSLRPCFTFVVDMHILKQHVWLALAREGSQTVNCVSWAVNPALPLLQPTDSQNM